MASTYVPTPVGGSIIGDVRLDFQVRDGAGYCPHSSDTIKRDKMAYKVILALLIKLEIIY